MLSLCSDETVSAKSALDLCINQMKNVLSCQQLPENASMETIGRAYHATETIVQVLHLPSPWNACLEKQSYFHFFVLCAYIRNQKLKQVRTCVFSLITDGYGLDICSVLHARDYSIVNSY